MLWYVCMWAVAAVDFNHIQQLCGQHNVQKCISYNMKLNKLFTSLSLLWQPCSNSTAVINQSSSMTFEKAKPNQDLLYEAGHQSSPLLMKGCLRAVCFSGFNKMEG